MKCKIKRRAGYAIAFILFLVIEFLIAVFVHDSFIRPYVGDVLVVIVIYCFVRIIMPEKFSWLPMIVFIFAVVVECLQYFDIVSVLGLEHNTFLHILIGSTFDVKDILCYGIGCILLGLTERSFNNQKKYNE